MGASHTTLASSAGTGDDVAPELEGIVLGQYEMSQPLFPGSGRMMRTFQLRHKATSSTAVLKSMWISKEHEKLVEQHEKELAKLKDALADQTHVAPFWHWTVGTYRPRGNLSVRQVSLLRPHIYTTLSDRLASRPFLTHVEKLWIAYQILQALDEMHSKGVVHGFLTTENIGLSSWNWVVLVDVASYKARTALPDDDPSEYLYYFQELYKHGTDTTPREKRCYLAPERFYTPNLESGDHPHQTREQPPLTPAMDIFSAGCVIMETFLNGERAFDLGDLMEYRKQKSSQNLQQKLNKIEFSALRAACRHMLNLDPSERLSAGTYLERLRVSELVPTSFSTLAKMMEHVTFSPPDARLAVATASYENILWDALGIQDAEGQNYVKRILGVTSTELKNDESNTNEQSHSKTKINETELPKSDEKKEEPSVPTDIFSETEALLKKLEALTFNEEEVTSMASEHAKQVETPSKERLDLKHSIKTSQMSQSSVLIFLQLVLSTVRHLQRPASKLVALQLMGRVAKYSTDEARLQRILPASVSLLHDQDPLVRASAITVLASTVSEVESFPPSDSKVFPQYIFKKVAHLITDPSLPVRLAFAKSVALLAETAHRFLDISHAVRLFEAVGGNGSGAPSRVESAKDSNPPAASLFADDVAKLLDEPVEPKHNEKKLEASGSGVESTASESVPGATKTLISSTYNAELAALQETVSRWVVHITTDQSEHSSPCKRALIADMARLCTFFGLDGVMAFILPQLLSFLNDRKDWQLRASLFETLPSVCHIIGRAATEHFVFPCLETALVDSKEAVISRALQCLSELLQMKLLSRSIILGGAVASGNGSSPGLLGKYGPLLVHPSADVRFFAVSMVNTASLTLEHPDAEVFVVPAIRPFLRFHPSLRHLATRDGLETCLQKPWDRSKYQRELDRLAPIGGPALSPTSGQWTSIALRIDGGDDDRPENELDSRGGGVKTESFGENHPDLQTIQVRSYLKMLARSRAHSLQSGPGDEHSRGGLHHAIEGSLKLAQQIKFPRQNVPGLPAATIPAWYNTLRNTNEGGLDGVSESAAIRSVSALGEVFGLSIMDQSAPASSSADISAENACSMLRSKETKQIQAACTGEWGSETCLDPALTDTSLLVTKLKALQVPPLPPKLAGERTLVLRVNNGSRPMNMETNTGSSEWKPRIDNLIASSQVSKDTGHTAPIVRLVVSHDQRFFVTASHDGTCRIWELNKAEKCNGVLESSFSYGGHTAKDNDCIPRINDLAMVEGGHSVVSGASDGSLRVWRVDMVSSTKQPPSATSDVRGSSRVAGSSEVRRVNPEEGEILAVNHFNTSSASVLTFATQKGMVHSWDLRCAREPFCLKGPQDIGYTTSLAMGSDRNWAVTGTSRGFITLWDLRFQRVLKLWHHSRAAPVKRLATSFVSPPQSWSNKGAANNNGRPFLFAACGPNECAMFDIESGSCSECFRTVDYGNRFSNNRLDQLPNLVQVPISNSTRRKGFIAQGVGSRLSDVVSTSFCSINAMVGSIGASDQSFLITGGSDCRIRFWDFAVPSKCYVSSGVDSAQSRPSFERVDYDQRCRLMLCRQPPVVSAGEVQSSRVPRKLYQGLRRPEISHDDSIQDLKVVKAGLLSCSRDSTVKLWR